MTSCDHFGLHSFRSEGLPEVSKGQLDVSEGQSGGFKGQPGVCEGQPGGMDEQMYRRMDRFMDRHIDL